jgi:hypothetical protein
MQIAATGWCSLLNHITLVYPSVAGFGEIKLTQLTGNPD